MRHNTLLAMRLCRLYVAAAFVVAAILSPPALAFVPALLAAAYLFLWWRPAARMTGFIADGFAFFALPLIFSQVMPWYLAVLTGFPAAYLVLPDLEVAAEDATPSSTQSKRMPSRVAIGLPLLAALAAGLAAALNSTTLLVNAAIAFVGLAVLVFVAFRRMPAKPAQESPIEERVIAGTKTDVSVELVTKTAIGGNLFLDSTDEWVKLHTPVLSLREKTTAMSLHFTPPLSGPSSLHLQGCAIDKWGLWQTRFSLEPVKLQVIPRARYAVWLAQKYLTESRSGMLPMISTVGTLRPLYGLRAGIEYYGSQLYQPGDSLKNIDWKHSIKYNKLISKEFADLRGQPAILLINVAAGDAEEADKQVYNTVVAALSLAHEQIPTSLAVYDDKEVRLVTASLPPQSLVARCLEVTRDIKIIGKPVKYLAPADVVRLRANIRRLRAVEGGPAQALGQVLQVEYQSLKNVAVKNPVGKALAAAFQSTADRASVVVASQLNHDAEAVSFNRASLQAKGNAMLVV